MTWNVELNRSLSDSWKVFTKFTLLKEKTPKENVWSGERLTKVQTTSRPDHVWPEVWTKIGKAAQNREKQEWKNEKPKLDNVRRLREDHIAGKGNNSLQHYNLVHIFIPMPQTMKIPDAKAAVDKKRKKLETTPAWQLEKVKSKKEVILEAKETKRKSSLPH